MCSEYAVLFFVLAKLKRVFNKLIIVWVCLGIYIQTSNNEHDKNPVRYLCRIYNFGYIGHASPLPSEVIIKSWCFMSQCLFVKDFYFSIFSNIFFCTQLAFVFHLLIGFYIVLNHIVTFCFSLLQKDFDTFHEHFLKLFFTFW